MPKFEVLVTAIGDAQGSISKVLTILFPETQIMLVQNVSLVQSPTVSDRPTIIVSKALHVSADCCCVVSE